MTQTSNLRNPDGSLTSESLAVLIVDALVYAHHVTDDNFEASVRMVTSKLSEIPQNTLLAKTIVDVLVEANFIMAKSAKEAEEIITLEINIRKHAGDYFYES